ncbi:hypothetical protein PS15m_012022 [Mucor circinelloides]
MVDNLRSWSIPFHKQDINAATIEETDGTTIDFIEFLNTTKKQVILVILDYAGQTTTNIEDLSEQRNITKIIVD